MFPTPILPTLSDALGRPLRDLRISLTDRCNFRCTYCMPREIFDDAHEFLPRKDLLSFEEIFRFAKIGHALGVRKLRLTGGEPLLRKDVETLVAALASLPGLDLALTTNGALLARKARGLAEAGLRRVTVSLDALDPDLFGRINGVGFPVDRVLEGIDAAADAGLPVKINVVVQKGVNDREILPLVRRFHGSGHVLRFIEYMDVGTTNGWRMDRVLPSKDVIARISREFPLEPMERVAPGETAERWRFADGAGELGVVSSVTRAFCADCSRIRLSPEGRLYTCLFATEGTDLRGVLRSGADDAAVAECLATLWGKRADRYSELRGRGIVPAQPLRRIEMSYIGG